MKRLNVSYLPSSIALGSLTLRLPLPTVTQAGMYACQTPSDQTRIQDRPCASDDTTTSATVSPRAAVQQNAAPTSGHGTDPYAGYCAEQYPDNFRMQRHCRETQRESFFRVTTRLRRLGVLPAKGAAASTGPNADTPLGRVMLTCMRTWFIPQSTLFNARMVDHCTKTQPDAYNRLR